MNILFDIPGKPLAKGRPRFARAGAFMRAYTPKETEDYENRIRMYFTQAAGKDYKLDEGPVRVSIVAYFDVPKAWSKKKRAEINGKHWNHTKKPDCDNLIKIVLDALNGIAWHDDSQVFMVMCTKYYSSTPHIRVEINGDT